MKIILWLLIILTTAILFYVDPWNNLPPGYSLILFGILGGPVTGTILLFRWIDEKAAKKQLCNPEIQSNHHSSAETAYRTEAMKKIVRMPSG